MYYTFSIEYMKFEQNIYKNSRMNNIHWIFSPSVPSKKVYIIYLVYIIQPWSSVKQVFKIRSIRLNSLFSLRSSFYTICILYNIQLYIFNEYYTLQIYEYDVDFVCFVEKGFNQPHHLPIYWSSLFWWSVLVTLWSVESSCTRAIVVVVFFKLKRSFNLDQPSFQYLEAVQ